MVRCLAEHLLAHMLAKGNSDEQHDDTSRKDEGR